MQRTSIIIPSFNGKEMLEECVESIRSYTDVPYEIIVVDNGSEDGTVPYCRQQKITFISLPENRGFPAACNIGLKVASGDTLMLLNNDVVVTHAWLENLSNCLQSSEKIGMVGPLTNYASGKQQVKADYEHLEQFHQQALEWNKPNPLLWRSTSRLVGFCLLFKREVMNCIGYLDERFLQGHYEDDDYCHRAMQAGYEMRIAGDVRVHHYGSMSFKKQTSEQIYNLVTNNHLKFIEKWGIDPHHNIES